MFCIPFFTTKFVCGKYVDNLLYNVYKAITLTPSKVYKSFKIMYI